MSDKFLEELHRWLLDKDATLSSCECCGGITFTIDDRQGGFLRAGKGRYEDEDDEIVENPWF